MSVLFNHQRESSMDKFCINCKRFLYQPFDKNHKDPHLGTCSAFERAGGKYLVTGVREYEFATIARADGNMCGVKAVKFVRKEVELDERR